MELEELPGNQFKFKKLPGNQLELKLELDFKELIGNKLKFEDFWRIYELTSWNWRIY